MERIVWILLEPNGHNGTKCMNLIGAKDFHESYWKILYEHNWCQVQDCYRRTCLTTIRVNCHHGSFGNNW